MRGPSDELVVQLAYRKTHKGNLPIENCIDVISVGSGFLRFLELARSVQKRVLVLTDNDGNPAGLNMKYKDYSGCTNIKISFVDEVHSPNDPNNVDPDKKLNWNTLEAEILRANGLDPLNRILDTTCQDEAYLLRHMEGHKTETALKLFDKYESVNVPECIREGLEWLDDGR